jgi:hypothetical protein
MRGAYHRCGADARTSSGPRDAISNGMMLDLGHNHPDFVYPNDQKQAKLALALSGFAALIISAMIALTVLA